MQLNAVVLPAPFGPMSPTISNSLTVRVRSWRACRPPKRIDRSVTSSTDTGALHRRGTCVRVVVELEAVTRHPAGDRAQLGPDPAAVEDEGLQEQERADERRQIAGLHVAVVVAAEERHVVHPRLDPARVE